jgi:choice-of-anchor C domain-containing protein
MRYPASIVVATALAAPGLAHANLLSNGQFASTCASGSFCTYSSGNALDIPGWLVIDGGSPTVPGGSVDLITGYWQDPPGGGNSVDLDGLSFGGLSTSFATVIGQEYSVSFYLSGNPDGAPATKDLGVDVAALSLTFSYPVTGTQASMNWVQQTFNFIATSALTTLSFVSLDSPSTSPGFYGPAIGDVAVVATPEPGALALLAVAALALLGFGARHRRAA